MFQSQTSQIKSVLPKFPESQIQFCLQQSRGDVNQSIHELLSHLPPKIENNVLNWFDFFDPSRIGLSQEDIIHALELTYGSDIREFDFVTSVKTMWPMEIPLYMKLSREVFAEPGEGMGIGIAEYARNISPIIADVTNIARVISPQISRQTIYDTLKSCHFDKFMTLKLLQSPSSVVPTPPLHSSQPQSMSHPTPPPPIYQATNIQFVPSHSAPPLSQPHLSSVSGPGYSMAPPHLPAPAPLPLQYRCSQCQKLVTMDSNNPKAIASPFLCNVCQYSPSSAIFPQSQTLPPSQVNATPPSHGAGPSPHSGYRPPAGISPAIPAPPMSPIHPKRSNLVRKALLIGINYHGQSGELRGCCNDVKEMYKLLTKIYGWDSSHFRILTDESLHLPNQLSSSHPRDSKPNKRNILDGMRWLSADVLPGDALFFHYSGHGAQQPDPNGIESDGMNETILPVDYQSEGMITDDQINSVLIQTLPDGVRLTCIMDSCHSGTGCDLPYTWNPRRHQFDLEPNPYFSLGDVILFSGCQDNATSCDVSSAFSAPGGAMTTAFTKALQRNPFPAYDELLDLLLQEMKSNGFQQKPQMSSSQEFEIGRPFSIIEALPNTNLQIGRTVTQRFQSSLGREGGSTLPQISATLFQILGLFQ